MKLTNEELQQIIQEELEAVLEEIELEERCQKGYVTHKTRKTKKMFGRTYRNCVKPKKKKRRKKRKVKEEQELEEITTLDQQELEEKKKKRKKKKAEPEMASPQRRRAIPCVTGSKAAAGFKLVVSTMVSHVRNSLVKKLNHIVGILTIEQS